MCHGVITANVMIVLLFRIYLKNIFFMLPFKQEIKTILSDYIPSGVLDEVCEMIEKHNVSLKITRSRKRIHGSYCRPIKNHSHRITVNRDLNPYMFLITLLHELAHLYAWVYDHSLKHDDTWKQHFSTLIVRFIQKNSFPEDVTAALLTHLKNVKSSDFLDIPLTRTLQAYDTAIKNEGEVVLSDLPMESLFMCYNKVFVKQKLLRKYFLCKDLKTNRYYRYHPLAKVLKLPEEN